MSSHPTLTLTVYILASVVFVLVMLYWIVYMRNLKTRRGAGTQAGIAIPTEKKEREGRTGSID